MTTAPNFHIEDAADGPPPPNRGRTATGKYAALFSALRLRTGWSRVVIAGVDGESVYAFAGAIRGGRLFGAEKGEFDAVARKAPDGDDVQLWIRYVPEHERTRGA